MAPPSPPQLWVTRALGLHPLNLAPVPLPRQPQCRCGCHGDCCPSCLHCHNSVAGDTPGRIIGRSLRHKSHTSWFPEATAPGTSCSTRGSNGQEAHGRHCRDLQCDHLVPGFIPELPGTTFAAGAGTRTGTPRAARLPATIASMCSATCIPPNKSLKGDSKAVLPRAAATSTTRIPVS